MIPTYAHESELHDEPPLEPVRIDEPPRDAYRALDPPLKLEQNSYYISIVLSVFSRQRYILVRPSTVVADNIPIITMYRMARIVN